MKKLPSKGKHMVKFGNHSHTKLAENLKDKSSKIIYIYKKQLRDTQKCKIWYLKQISKLQKRKEQKYRIFKMHLKLRDEQLKIITYMYRLLYKNFMVSTNLKSVIGTYTQRNPNTKDSHQVTVEESKRRKEQKRTLETSKQITK